MGIRLLFDARCVNKGSGPVCWREWFTIRSDWMSASGTWVPGAFFVLGVGVGLDWVGVD